MAEITSTRDHDPYGELEYCVEWEDNEGVVRERYFTSRRAADRFAVDIESDLLNESVANLQAALASMTPEEVRPFNTRLKTK